jgi:hypothetical protein
MDISVYTFSVCYFCGFVTFDLNIFLHLIKKKKLMDMSGIYCEMSSPTPSNKTSHEVNIFFLHSIYINIMLTTINYILLLPETNREWLLSDSVKHVITPALWTIDMDMLS